MKIDYSRIYQKFHADTPEHRAYMVAFYQRVLRSYLPAERNAPILDVGCGTGYVLLALKELGYTRAEGVEADESQVVACTTKGLSVQLTQDTRSYLASQAGRFHLILALDLIEHIPVDQQLEFVHALLTALVPGGKLICTVPNANSILASRYRYICWTHHASFTEHSLDFLLYNAGFRDIQIGEIEYFERPRWFWLPLTGGVRHYWAFRFFRFWRRLEMMAELGPSQGRTAPLSLNLFCVAARP